MPSRNTIEIVINATDNASGVFNKLTDNTQSIGKAITTGIIGGLAAGGVAIAGFVAKGISEFTTFQQGMQEIFSLIPGISQDAMDEISGQVKTLSERFGVLPEKTIPAFYEALSAGIPPDNVFSFVETANKAAIAGVTELDTAVSGISSVMNAYGHDVLDATKTSDLMFQAVKLGKTTFEELSQSIYNVTPTAAGLGISFEEVSAQLAAITAAGVPTSVATTQMRDLFNQLSKAGTKTADLFQQLAGKSFRDFIKEGHTVQDALQLMEKHAKDSGLSITDLFTSVEAANAALNLTGGNTERYTDFLSQMQSAAGSTQTAFETMSDSIQFQSNRLQAKLSNLFIEIGSKFAPIAKQAFEDIGDVVSFVTGVISGEITQTSDSFVDAFDGMNPALRPFLMLVVRVADEIKRVTSIIGRFINGVRGGVPFLDNLKAVMYSLFPKETADGINVIINAVNDFVQKVKPVIESVVKWIQDNVELKDVLIAMGLAISSFVIPAITAIAAPIAGLIATFGLLVGAVTLLRKAWETDFLGIQTFVTEKLIPALQMLADWFINDALPKAIDFIQNVATPALQLFVQWLGGIWESIKPGLESIAKWFISEALPGIVNFITGTVIPAIGNFIGILINIWNTVKPHLENLAKWFIQDALPAIVNFVQNTVIPGIQNFINLLLGIWDKVSPILTNLFNWFVTDALPAIVTFINDTVLPAVQGFIDLLVNIWNTVSPTLQILYDWFVTDALPKIVSFIEETVKPGVQGLIDIISGIWTAVSPFLEDLKRGIEGVFNWIKTNVIDPIIQRIEEFKKTLSDLAGGLGAYQGAANNAQTAANLVTSGQVSPGDFASGLFRAIGQELHIGGYNGLDYVPRNMTMNVHKGERILTAQENADYSGQNNNSKPQIVIQNLNIGNISNQNDANDKARMFVNGLRAQGMEI